MYELMYPVGKFEVPNLISENHCNQWKQTIDECPTLVIDLTKSLDHQTLNWKYRPHGWTIAQVVHHLSDSHMNALIRFKLALTEDTPVIKPYLEGFWANLADYDIALMHYSLNILEAVHVKWVNILNSMDIHDFHKKSYYHPESQKNFTLGEALGLYDWHCKHHIAHIKQALQSEGKF